MMTIRETVAGWVTCTLFSTLVLALWLQTSARADPIEIGIVNHDGDVSFQGEILPVLRKKCLACHNETDAESDLVLESPATILKGGAEGPAVVAGNSKESLLLNVAAHIAEPVMPPEDNDVGADNLTSTELGLLKLWIDQGAKGDVDAVADAINWQALPPGVNPVYAVAMSPDGMFVVAGRANQVFIYRGREELGRLSDDDLVKSQPTVQAGVAHLDMVQSLAFSPSGGQIASGGYRTIKLWQQASPLVSELQLTTDTPFVVTASRDGRMVIVADQAGNLTVWNDGQKTAAWLAHAGSLQAVAISEDSQRLATIGDDKLLKIWQLKDQAEISQTEFGGQANDMAWSGDRIAIASDDHHVQLWQWDRDSNQISLAGQLEGHTQPVTVVATVGDEGLLSASRDGSVRQWDLQAMTQTQQLNHGGPVNAIAVSTDGSICVAGGDSSGTKLWKLADGTEVATLTTNLQLRDDHHRCRFEFEVAQRQVANAKKDLEAGDKRKKQEADNLKKVEESRKKADEELKKKQEAAAKADEAVVAAQAEHQAAVAKQKENQQQLETAKSTEPAEDDAAADAAIMKSKKAVEEANKKLEGSKKAAKKAADEFTAAQRTLESSERSLERAKTALADAEQALEPLRTSVTHAEEIVKTEEAEFKAAEKIDNEFRLQASCIAIANDGDHFSVGSPDGSLYVFRLSDGAPVQQMRVGDAALISMTFSGEHKLSGVDAVGVLRHWDLLPRWDLSQVIGSPNGDSPFDDRITALAFSPDGEFLAVGGGEPSRIGELKIVSVRDGIVTKDIKDAHSDTVFGLAFSPDGKRLASCGADRFMKVFDVATGALVKTFEGHTHHVLDVAWQADGRVLSTAGADKVVKVWDFNNGAQIRTIQGFGKEVTALEFAGATNKFFATCGDRSLYRCNTEGARDGIGSAGDFLYSVSSNRTGDAVVFAGHDSVVRMVNADGKEMIEHAAP